MATLPGWIYKNPRTEEMYLYALEQGYFWRVPEPLLEHSGAPRLVMELSLDANRRLSRVDAAVVLSRLRESGWYPQLPPPDPARQQSD